MSSILDALYTRLSTTTGVTAEVSTRIYPSRAPQGAARPYLTMHRVSMPHEHHMTGAAGLTRPRVQISAWADRADQAESAAEAVRVALQGFTGTVSTVKIRQCHLDSQRDAYDPPADSGDVGRHAVHNDYMIWHTESKPSF